MQLELPLNEQDLEEHDYDTIGGFVMGMLDKIPAEGDHFEFKHTSFEVLELDDKRIVKVKAVKQSPAAEEAEVASDDVSE